MYILDERKIAEVSFVLEKLTIRKRPERRKSKWTVYVERTADLIRNLALVGLLVCFTLAIISVALDSHSMTQTVLAMLLLVDILACALIISPVALSIPFFKKLSTNPFYPIIESLKDASTGDLSLSNELMKCDREAVEYMLSHYRHQRLSFERRGAMLSGYLDKIGFFPALAALVLLVAPTWEHLNFWVKDFVLLVPAFHFMNLLGYGIVQEMDRTIVVLEYCVAAHARYFENE